MVLRISAIEGRDWISRKNSVNSLQMQRVLFEVREIRFVSSYIMYGIDRKLKSFSGSNIVDVPIPVLSCNSNSSFPPSVFLCFMSDDSHNFPVFFFFHFSRSVQWPQPAACAENIRNLVLVTSYISRGCSLEKFLLALLERNVNSENTENYYQTPIVTSEWKRQQSPWRIAGHRGQATPRKPTLVARRCLGHCKWIAPIRIYRGWLTIE